MTAGQPRNGGVIFDVDGTLLDTNYLHVAAWWEAFRERGHDICCTDVHRALGMASAELVERVLGRPDQPVIEAHSRHFAPYLGRIRPLPGAADLLTATAGLGLSVVLATSAKDDEVELMLDALNACDAIGTVVSSGAVERAKPNPDIVERALSESGTDRARAVMIGDAVWDVIAARRAGLPCIGLLSGGIAEDQLRGAGAVEIYADPADLLGNLQGSTIGKLASGKEAMLGPQAGEGTHSAERRTSTWGICTLVQAAGPDAASLSMINTQNPANLCLMNGLPSGSIVIVSPIGFIGSVGAQPSGFSGGTFYANTSGGQGEYYFAAFPGS